MRRVFVSAGIAALASVLFFSTAAHAGCPIDSDGQLGASAKTYTVPLGPAGTWYVDDRQYYDIDDDDRNNGIWLYEETNKQAGLQRGGKQWMFATLPGRVPYIPPTKLVPANPGGLPVFPNGVTLCPNGCGDEPIADFLGFADPCQETTKPDRIWF